MNQLPDKLSPPSTKTPLMDKGKETLNHNWQRWFSDLYLYVKSQESLLTSVSNTTDIIINGGGAAGPQGPQGIQGVKGDQGIQGVQGVTGLLLDVLADGGLANSVYLPLQSLDGGGA